MTGLQCDHEREVEVLGCSVALNSHVVVAGFLVGWGMGL